MDMSIGERVCLDRARVDLERARCRWPLDESEEQVERSISYNMDRCFACKSQKIALNDEQQQLFQSTLFDPILSSLLFFIFPPLYSMQHNMLLSRISSRATSCCSDLASCINITLFPLLRCCCCW
jgi:hypothetical protein